jgi:hypothetical protein
MYVCLNCDVVFSIVIGLSVYHQSIFHLDDLYQYVLAVIAFHLWPSPFHVPAFCSTTDICWSDDHSHTTHTCQYGFFDVLSRKNISQQFGIDHGVYGTLCHFVSTNGDPVFHQLSADHEKFPIGLFSSSANFFAHATHCAQSASLSFVVFHNHFWIVASILLLLKYKHYKTKKLYFKNFSMMNTTRTQTKLVAIPLIISDILLKKLR